jgi:hypothetical protein
MKTVVILLAGFTALAAASVLHAQEAWLLLSRSGQYELERAADGKLESVMNIGSVAAYGESPQALAFIHHDPTTREYRLDVLDKASRRVTATYPVEARLQAHSGGVVQDLVVTPRYVYFAAIRLNSAHQVSLNSLGGRLDLNQISLSDGTLKSFPLPPACHTARLVDYDGAPLVYAWNGYGVWKLDEVTMALVPMVQERDVEDIVASERGDCGCKRSPGPGPFADDVAIPGAGVFRLSRTGKLQQLLDAHLGLVSQPRLTVDLGLELGRDGQFATLFRSTVNGHAVIGVLGVRSGQMLFEYRDPSSLQLTWQARLPASAGALGAGNLATVADGVLFVDPGQGTIVKATAAGGPQVLWNLHQLDPTADPASTQVILVREPPQAGAGS